MCWFSMSSSSSWTLSSSFLMWHCTYWISQQLGPKGVTLNNMSPWCLKIMMSPIWRLCAVANSFQPSVSLRPSIFTCQILSEASDISLAVFCSFFPSMCFEKNVTGIDCNHQETTFKTKPTLKDRRKQSKRERERVCVRGESRNREEVAGRNVDWPETEVDDSPFLTIQENKTQESESSTFFGMKTIPMWSLTIPMCCCLFNME